MIADDLDGIWSIDLVYVDKVADYYKGFKKSYSCSGLHAGCFGVRPLKSKCATSTAETFTKIEKKTANISLEELKALRSRVPSKNI